MVNFSDFFGKMGSSINNIVTDLPIYADKAKEAIGNAAKTPGMIEAATMAANTISSLLPEKTEYSGDYGAYTLGIDSGYDAAMGAVAAIPGFGQAAAGIMAGNKLLGNVANNLGMGTDGMTKTDSILGSSIFATNLGLVNGALGKRTDTLRNGYTLKETLANIGSDYGSSVKLFNEASQKSNKKYGVFSSGSRRSANREIREANRLMLLMTGINALAKDLINTTGNMTNFNTFNYLNTINGGYDPRSYLGRNGLKLDLINHTKLILKEYNTKKYLLGGLLNESYFIPTDWLPSGSYIQSVDKFQKGGLFNVLPTGALHARLHHMEDADKITKKGIPVIDNDGNQMAEIEKDEIIFRKEVTDKIEALAKDGSDEAAIECGKLLTKEIILNTLDNSNLIPKSFKRGGVLKAELGTLMYEWALPEADDSTLFGEYFNPFKDTTLIPYDTATAGKPVPNPLQSTLLESILQAMPLTPQLLMYSTTAGEQFGLYALLKLEEQNEELKKETTKQLVLGVAKAIGKGVTAGILGYKKQLEANNKLRAKLDEAFYKSLNGGNLNAKKFGNLFQLTSMFLNGGNLTDDEKYEIYRNSLPYNLYATKPEDYNLRRYWELKGKPPVFNPQAKDPYGDNIYNWNPDDKSYHTNSVAYNKDTDEYEFMKNRNHETLLMELDWYNSPAGRDFKKEYELITTDENGNPLEFYKYVRRK